MSGATTVPLTTSGLREAHEISQALAHEKPFSHLYSSPLDRALDTARIIARRCGLQLEVAPLLGEIDCLLPRGRAGLVHRGDRCLQTPCGTAVGVSLAQLHVEQRIPK